MGVRFGANVERSLGTVKHYVGLPPRLTGGRDTRSLMPTADVALIAEEGGPSTSTATWAGASSATRGTRP